MKTHVGWLVLCLVAITTLSGVVWYKSSWMPDYHEAEPLFPIVADFGRELSEKTKGRRIEIEDLESLLAEERFRALRKYGFVLTDRKEELIVVRVNKTFNFRIGSDGYPEWEKK